MERRFFSLFDFVGAVAFGILFVTDLGDEPLRWLVFSGGMSVWMAVSFAVKILLISPRTRVLVESWVIVFYGATLTLAFAPFLLDAGGWDGVADWVAAVSGVAFCAIGLRSAESLRDTERSSELR